MKSKITITNKLIAAFALAGCMFAAAQNVSAAPILAGESLNGFSVDFTALAGVDQADIGSQLFEANFNSDLAGGEPRFPLDPFDFGETSASSSGVPAVEIVYDLTLDVSGPQIIGTFEYTVFNNSFFDIEDFTVFFDVFVFESIANGIGPLGFDDVLLIQPDAELFSDGFFDILSTAPAAVPEPGSLSLLGIGLLAVMGLRRTLR